MKTVRLTVQVLPTHKRILERIAQTEGEPVAVVVRRLIRLEGQKRGLWLALKANQVGDSDDGD